ncbi:MAG TPA: organic solvent ABC transporter ATP-binding protein [Kiritimatiellia bacterium]|nr:organic solvent ABC transporter ATP-binding protein [Kiritimatiellia bacterium]
MSLILDMREVVVDARPPYDGGLNRVSLSLSPGELFLVRVPDGAPITPLADAACGMLVPEAGAVLFDGREWASCSADEAAAARGRIGRVFERAGWLSNLDVDENITLAQRYHLRRTPEETLEEARALARELGMSGIPAGRPAFVERELLLRAQWIRALMGKPALVLLERPGRDMSANEVAPLVSAVNKRREHDGTAVLWLTDAHERVADSALRATQKCAMEEGVLRPLDTP